MGQKMDFKIIKSLSAENFMSGGKVYIHYSPSDPQKRKQLVVEAERIKTGQKYPTVNYDVKAILETENNFKARYAEEVMNAGLETNPADIDEVKGAVESLSSKLLFDDVVVLLPSSGISSKELHDINAHSIIYFELHNGLNLGFVVDKIFLSAILQEKTE